MKYTIRRATEQEAEQIIALIREVYEGMNDRSLFAYDGEDADWLRQQMKAGGYAVVAEPDAVEAMNRPEGRIAAAGLVRFPKDDDEDLGRDVGLAEEQLAAVSYMEFAVVHPEHRGNHLEYEMICFAEQQPEAKLRPYMLATVSPANGASLHSLQKAGFRIGCTKEKYGGKLRHIMIYHRIKK